MRLKNIGSIVADIVAWMTIDAHFVRRDVTNRFVPVWIAEKNDRVYKIRGGSVIDEKLEGIVDHLTALTVAADTEFGLRALRHGLLDELGGLCQSCLPLRFQ